MKKTIIKLLLLLQVLWVFHGGVVLTQDSSATVGKMYSYNYDGFYGLVKIACTTFVESINRVVELSCDLPVFPEKRSDTQPVQKVFLYFANFVSNMMNFKPISKITELVLDLSGLQNFQLLNFNITMNYLWLMFLFLYLYRLRYFFLRARSSISHNGILILGIETENPNCFWDNSQEQLGFFIYNRLKKIVEVKIYE